MEHLWDLLFQLMKHEANNLHVPFLFLCSVYLPNHSLGLLSALQQWYIGLFTNDDTHAYTVLNILIAYRVSFKAIRIQFLCF